MFGSSRCPRPRPSTLVDILGYKQSGLVREADGGGGVLKPKEGVRMSDALLRRVRGKDVSYLRECSSPGSPSSSGC